MDRSIIRQLVEANEWHANGDNIASSSSSKWRWKQPKSSTYNLHPNQVSSWKKRLLEAGPGVFRRDAKRGQQEQVEREADLYEQIGRLKMELEWLKKKAVAFD